MKVAIAHEWLAGPYGSEKVFLAMAKTFPDADLLTLTCSAGASGLCLPGPVTTSRLQRLPESIRTRRQLLLPLMPGAWRGLRNRSGPYDVVLTSSHVFARYFADPSAADQTHLSYVHTPMRFAWYPGVDGRGSGRVLAPARAFARAADAHTVRRTDSFAANSQEVQRRIREVYGRESVLIHPPVDVGFFSPGASRTHQRGPFLLAVSRWVDYKRLDLAIRVASELGVTLVMAGGGPAERMLRALAIECGANVQWVVDPTDVELRDLYRTAAALIFPAEEDFGIIPVEAQACGTPVVALARAGTAETVVDGVSGLLVDDQTVPAFADACSAAMVESRSKWAEGCRDSAERFSQDRFSEALLAWVNDEVAQ